MKSLFLKPASALLLFSGLSVLGSTAALADTKVFQADSVCRGTLVPTFSNGALANTSLTLPVTVYCAINRDRTDLKPTAVQVSVVDNSSLLIGDGNFSCFLTPVSRFGVLGAPGSTVTTSGVNSAGTILTVPLPAVVPTDGTLTLKCKVPRRGLADPSSVLASIKVIEPDPTN
jgi:hypothetical protein